MKPIKRVATPAGTKKKAKVMTTATTNSRGLVRRGQLNKEVNYFDFVKTQSFFNETAQINLVFTIPQGTGVTGRIGKKVTLQSFQFRGFASSNGGPLVNDCAMMLVYDKRPTGSLPAVTDILTSISSQAMANDSNTSRFKILKRNDFYIAGTTAGGFNSASVVDLGFYIRCNLPVVYKAAGTGAIGDIEEGAVYMVTCGTVASQAFTDFTIRTRYIDN